MGSIAAAILAASLVGGASMPGQPLYIGDLVHQAPDFTNAPDFSLNGALQGTNFIGQPGADSRKNKRQRTRELVDMLQAIYPDATIVVYQDHIFVK
jgi:hypothetical protein